MSTIASYLLQQLASGVRRAAVPGSTPPAGVTGSVAAGQFADLLRRAQAGELASNRPVSIGPNAKVKLTEDQLAQISLAADKAEVAGVRNALVLIGGQAVKLDVANREITGAADLSAGVLAGIDGVINLDTERLSASQASATIPVPAAQVSSPSLATLLAAVGGGRPSEKAA